MTNYKLLINKLRKFYGETEWFEFKKNNSKPELVGEYISALANSAILAGKKSAYLIYGIDDDSHDVVGTSFSPKQTKKGNEELEAWLAKLLNPRIEFKFIELDDYEEKKISIIDITANQTYPVSFNGIEYIRVGSNKKKLKEYPEKEREFWDILKKYSFESSIAFSGATSDQVLDYLDYPSYFKLMGLNLPDRKSGILEKFEQEKMIIKSGDLWDVTNLGAILFASDLSYFENLSRKAIRVIFYRGKNKLETIKEKVNKKGYAVGFEDLINNILDMLPSNEVLEDALRKEVKMYPAIAIRELIANAIIHQDFRVRGSSPMVEVFDDRIEITNPGKPLIETDRFIDHIPESRNDKLAHLMRRLNICEERGSGIDKVINSVEVHQLPAPSFHEGDRFLRVILFAHKSLRQMDRQDKLRACYQHCCLKYVAADHMTNQSLRERFNIEPKNYATVSRIIRDTIDSGFVKESDPENKSRKHAKYVPFWA